MIPAPTNEDFARDAENDYGISLHTCPTDRTEARLAWIRLAEHYRVGRQTALESEGNILRWVQEVEAERHRLAAENAELRKYIACRSVETFNDSPSMQREKP